MTDQACHVEETASLAPAFRSAFRRSAGTVSVITAGGIRPVGFTATSLVSVSVAPPLVSFNISATSSSWPTVSRAGHLAAHVLGTHQRDVATAFATSGIDRFAAAGEWEHGRHGVPLLRGALARLVLGVESITQVGDSAVVLARAVEIEHTDGTPLLYHDGAYRDLALDEPVVTPLHPVPSARP